MKGHPPTPTKEEWHILWEHHKKYEIMHRDAGYYVQAQINKLRHEEIARFFAPQDEWERAWSAKP